jgi:hypothetical protein
MYYVWYNKSCLEYKNVHLYELQAAFEVFDSFVSMELRVVSFVPALLAQPRWSIGATLQMLMSFAVLALTANFLAFCRTKKTKETGVQTEVLEMPAFWERSALENKADAKIKGLDSGKLKGQLIQDLCDHKLNRAKFF